MLHTLHETKHDILLAHERARLAAHHYACVALAQLGAATDPVPLERSSAQVGVVRFDPEGMSA